MSALASSTLSVRQVRDGIALGGTSPHERISRPPTWAPGRPGCGSALRSGRVRDADRYSGPYQVTPAYPALILNNRHDPIPPWRNAVTMSRLLRGSRLADPWTRAPVLAARLRLLVCAATIAA